MLGAREKGLGGCMHGAVNKKKLAENLGLPEKYEILVVLSLGKPNETVIIDDVPPGGSTTYYHDANSATHVPKRRLEDIIIR